MVLLGVGNGWFQRTDADVYIYISISGQIITTSAEVTPNGGLVRETSLFQGNPGW